MTADHLPSLAEGEHLSLPLDSLGVKDMKQSVSPQANGARSLGCSEIAVSADHSWSRANAERRVGFHLLARVDLRPARGTDGFDLVAEVNGRATSLVTFTPVPSTGQLQMSSVSYVDGRRSATLPASADHVDIDYINILQDGSMAEGVNHLVFTTRQYGPDVAVRGVQIRAASSFEVIASPSGSPKKPSNARSSGALVVVALGAGLVVLVIVGAAVRRRIGERSS
jgi:hypothetical protein